MMMMMMMMMMMTMMIMMMIRGFPPTVKGRLEKKHLAASRPPPSVDRNSGMSKAVDLLSDPDSKKNPTPWRKHTYMFLYINRKPLQNLKNSSSVLCRNLVTKYLLWQNFHVHPWCRLKFLLNRFFIQKLPVAFEFWWLQRKTQARPKSPFEKPGRFKTSKETSHLFVGPRIHLFSLSSISIQLGMLCPKLTYPLKKAA